MSPEDKFGFTEDNNPAPTMASIQEFLSQDKSWEKLGQPFQSLIRQTTFEVLHCDTNGLDGAAFQMNLTNDAYLQERVRLEGQLLSYTPNQPIDYDALREDIAARAIGSRLAKRVGWTSERGFLTHPTRAYSAIRLCRKAVSHFVAS